MKPAIEVKGVWKQYLKGVDRRYKSLRDTLAGLPSLLRGEDEETFWALQDISFDVEPGESIGIIGKNGAGKSTLLKILSRITPPTKGEIILRGRVASLLEVGTGFHPELTGRENIFFNGSILGMKYAEIRSRFDEIVDFSGVETFLDTPLKHYSSGMQMRLAFSVAAHLDSEILLIDEVLAVGDAEFQNKCMGKMDEVSSTNGKTVLFVSHSLGLIQNLCKEAILLNGGEFALKAEVSHVLEHYLAIKTISRNFSGPLSRHFKLNAIKLNGNAIINDRIQIHSGNKNEFSFEFLKDKYMYPFRIAFALFYNEIRLYTLYDVAKVTPSANVFTSYFPIPAEFLRPGFFKIGLGGYSNEQDEPWFWNSDIMHLEVINEWEHAFKERNTGIINMEINGTRNS